MNFATWRRRLEAQRGGAPAWEPSPSDPSRRRALACLLRAYAESESAEEAVGDALLARATDPDDRAALSLLLEDERRHASILIETAARLDPTPWQPPPPSGRLARMGSLVRRLGLVDTLVVFHLFEIAAVSVYRLLRATNRHDPLVRAALGLVLRDEAAHTSFHEARLVEALEGAGTLGRARMRAVHAITARLVVLNEGSVAPKDVYPEATGLSFTAFNAKVIRMYERAYAGRLRGLRG